MSSDTKTLQEIAGELRAAIEEYGELTEIANPSEDDKARAAELETIIGASHLDLQSKADAYKFVRESLKARVAELDALMEPLERQRAAAMRNLESLRERMESVVAAIPGGKIKTNFTSASVYPIKGNILTIPDENAVPMLDDQGNATPWWRRPPPQIDRMAIKMALKNGGSVPWAKLEDGQGFRWQ